MIKLTRVDYRLIHGQVAMSWTHALDVDCILLASDAVAKDDMRKAALRLARPSGVKLVIKDVDAAIEALNSGVTDKYSLFIIAETIEDVYRLAKGCKDMVAKTSKRSIWVEPERPPRPRFIRPLQSSRPRKMPSISKNSWAMAWSSKSVRFPMTLRCLPRTFFSRKHAGARYLLNRYSMSKPVDHLIDGLFIEEKSKKFEIVLA